MPINNKVKEMHRMLQSAGADVGNENEFNDWFFARGEEGYKNRKYVFDTFKQAGADVGENYEEFAGLLNLQPEGPDKKGGRIGLDQGDMSDFQQTIDNANQTLGQTRRTVNRIGNRQQRIGLDLPRTDFGRVNLGENRKVTKGQQYLNPETGQLEETYITPQGNEYERRGMADLEQNSVDQQEWEINNPKEALRRRIDSQIADIEAKRKELTGPGGAPRNVFTNMYAGGQGAPVQRTADDQRLDDLTMALKDLTDARTRMERGEQLQASSDFLGGVGVPFTKDWFNNWKNFGYGVWDALSDPGLYDFGISDVAKAGMYGRIKRKIENGEELSDTETALALAGMAKAQTEQMVTLPHGYTAGVTTTEMAPFMAQMAMSPLSGTGRALARKAVRTFGRDGLKAVSARVGARVLGNLAEAGVLSNTLQAGKTAADIMNRYSGDSFAYDDDGNLKIGYYEEGPDGEAQFVEGGKSALRSIYEGEAASIIENFTELGFGGKLGGMLSKAAGTKLGQKMGLGYISDLVGKVGSTPFAKGMKRFMERTHWDGMIEEPLEEEYGIVLNVMLGTGDAKISDLWDSEKQADIFAGTMWFGGMMAAMNTAAYPFAKRQMKRNLNNADIHGEMVFGDEWPVMKTTIDNMDDKGIAGFLYGLKDNDKFSNEQKAAMFGYAARLKQYQGANVADMLMRMEGNLSEGDTMVKNAYDVGTEAETPDEKKSFVDEAQAAQDNLSQYGKEFAVMVTAGSDNPANTLDYMMSNRDTYSDQEIAAAADYYQKQASAQGVMDAAIDGVDLEVEKANAEVRSNTHQQTGDVITAQVGDGAYYLIGGDVATDEESGMPVVVGTGGAAVVKDAVTGEVSVVPAQQVTVTSMTSADEMMQYNDQVLRQQLMQQADDDITFGSPANEVFDLEDTVTLQDGNGGVIEGQVVTLPNAVDGVFVIQTSDGRALQMTADDINRRIVAHNGREVQRNGNNAPENIPFEGNKADQNIPSAESTITEPVIGTSATESKISGQNQQGGILDNATGEEVSANPNEGVNSNQSQSALSRIPVRMDEKGQPMTNRKGKPVLDWHKASTEDAAAALVETTGGDMVTARDTANDLVNVARTKLEKIRKQKPKGEDPLEIAESRQEIKRAEQEQQDIIRKWQDVAAHIGRQINEESERKRLEAEAAKSEEQRQREAEEIRIRKEKQDEADRKRIREAIERDHEKRNREYEPLVKARQEMADDAEALSILNDTEPRSLKEWVSSLLRPHSMLWQDASKSETGLQRELGLKRADMQRMMTLLGTKESGAKPFGMITDEIHEGLPEAMKNMYDTEDVRHTLLDLFNEGSSTRMMHLTEEHRIEEARQTMQENLRRDAESEMEAWAEAYHLTPEERETFEDFIQQPPLEPEQEVIYQIIAENEQQNLQSNRVDRQPVIGTDAAGAEGGEGQVRQTVEAAGNGNPQQGIEQGTEAVTGEPPAADNNVAGGTPEGEPQPIGTGDFGDIYDQFRGKPKEAIDFLTKKKGGEALGALSHKDIGEIDLVWGEEGTGHSDGYGLAKLVKYHPEVLDNLQEILDEMEVVKRTENRINLESDKYKAAVRLTWNEESKTWLLTVFEKKNSALDNTTDTGETSNRGKRNDTATPQSTVSEDLIADLREPGQSDAAADVSKPQTPDENGGEPINAETQTSSSEGKGTNNILNNQEKEQKNYENERIELEAQPRGTGAGTEMDHVDTTDEDASRNDEGKGSLQETQVDSSGNGEADHGQPGVRQTTAGADAVNGLPDRGVSVPAEGEKGVIKPIGKTSSPEEIAEEEAKVNTNPTEGQKEAGNYQMGHINIDGYDITIENPKGSIRSGVDGNGKAWSQEMHNTYGYIRGTEGVDGDHIDVFLSDNPTRGHVFVVDQVNPETGEFDEHKVMYGFADAAEATKAYLSNYEPGWKGLGAISGVSRVEFKKWVESSHRKTKPFAEYALVKREQAKQKKSIVESVQNHLGNYRTLAPVEVIDIDSDEDLRRITGEEEVGEIRQYLKEHKLPAVYDPVSKKIYIFAGNIGQDHVEEALFHESIHRGLHQYYGDNPIELAEAFWETESPDKPEATKRHKEAVSKQYADKPEDIKEEYFANLLSHHMVKGSVDRILSRLSPEHQEIVNNILQNIGYDTTEETKRRTAEGNEYTKGPGALQNPETGGDGRRVNPSKQQDKIEDVGEQIAGARKDMTRKIAQTIDSATKQTLAELPFSKAYKKPDLKKAVEEGALRESDATFYDAWFATMVNPAKPKVTQSEARSKRWNPGYRTKLERWVDQTYDALQLLKQFVEASEEGRDLIISKLLEDRYPNREAALAEIEKRKEWNKDRKDLEWGDKTSPNPLWVTYEVMKRLGYTPGDKLDIQYGIVQANSTGTGYGLYNNKEEKNYYLSPKDIDEAIDDIVYLARLKRGDADVQHPVSMFFTVPTKSEYGDSGRYRVSWGAWDRPHTQDFDSKDEADAFSQKKKGSYVSPIKEVVRRYGYKVKFRHPLNGEIMSVDDREFDTKDEANAYLDENYDTLNEEVNGLLDKDDAKAQKKELTPDDMVYTAIVRGRDGKYSYAVLIDKQYANNFGMPLIVKEGFGSRNEAKEFADGVKQNIFDTYKSYKSKMKSFTYFDTGKDSRAGEDYRGGRDVTAEDFMNTFGFRGVQFGNWTNQRDRQMAVNQAYDSFMDLAKLIGVSPKALSLNGELGIAFGARGSGNFAAHYEPGEIVINLTKTMGAGSLAHEWWHALDNYFSRAAGQSMGMVTDDKAIPMREELRKAYNDLVSQIQKSNYYTRSKNKGDYWGRMHEVTARLLAEWVDQELKKRGELNTFLSRGANTDQFMQINYERYKAHAEMAGEDVMPFEEFQKLEKAMAGSPYPSKAEVDAFSAAMRNIFDVMEERTDPESGKVALYQKVAPEGTDAQTEEDNILRDVLIDEMRNAGIDVITDTEEGQEMLDEANKAGKVKPQKVESAVFYSNALKAVQGINQEKATPEQWLKMIEKGGGLKAGEDKWIGLSDWLKQQQADGKKSVTKQEIEDYIRRNQIKVEDVNYLENPNTAETTNKELVRRYPTWNKAFELEFDEEAGDAAWVYFVKDTQEAVNIYNRNSDNPIKPNKKGYFSRDDKALLLNWANDVASNIARERGEIEGIRLDYTTEGLENKKEIALTVPTIEPYGKEDKTHFGDAGGGRAVAWVRFGETTIDAPAEGLDKGKYTAVPAKGRVGFVVYRPNGTEYGYIGSPDKQHCIDAAYKDDVARNRTKKKVLVIDEIQSKRHQDAREKGYKEDFNAEELQKAREESREYSNYLYDKYIRDKHPGEDFLDYATDEEKTRFHELTDKASSLVLQEKSGVPAAPFEKNWHELAMKRMLRYAAEKGYDHVAWTKGNQQAERYSLGKMVNRITIQKITATSGEPDSYRVTTWDNEAKSIESASGVMNEDRIKEVFGKGLSSRMVDAADKSPHSPAVIEGDGLMIGGEGMKGFYDQILPRFMDKYGKKWGVKTSEIDLPGLEESAQKMWSVPVTTEMRESVMEGQPMFFKTKDGHAYGFAYKGRIYVDPSIATSETPIHEYCHLWAEMKRQTAPEEWDNIKQVIMSDPAVQPFVEKVRRQYPELSGKEDDFIEEVLTQYSGRTGAEKLRKVAEEIARENGGIFGKAQAVEALRRMRNILARFWQGIARMMGWRYTTAEQIADSMLYDLLTGVNPTEDIETPSEEVRPQRTDAEESGLTAYDDVALRMYEETMAKESTKRQEVIQDSMVALKAIQDAIAAETGRKATGAEDAYRYENRMHGRAKNMTEKYDWNFYRPMLRVFHDFCKAKGLTEERGLEYLISKSGLERNVYYAFRDAVKEKVAEKIKNQREKLEKDYANRRLSESEYKAKKKELAEKEQSGVDDAMQEVRDTLAYKRAKEDYASGTIGYTEYIRRIESVIRSHVGNYDNYAKDYSGLTETFAKEMYDEAQDVRKMAQKAIDTKDRRELWKQYDQKMREAYIMARQMAEDAVFSAENDGREAADSLWERINAATKETLRHSYESGLIDRNNYNKVRDMFDYYIPLRGWDEDKASDVYSYMGKENVFSPAVKKTWGRSSKAENPLAYIGNIAVSTILSGNRNQMKQHFLNYVLNNPTSLVSISESWYENIAPDGERPMWVLRSADTAGKSGDEIAQIVNDFNEEMQRKQREGRAMPVRGRLRLDVHATSGQKAEHVVEVQRAGRTYQLYINGNPRATQALNGINAKVNRLRDIPKVGPFLSRLNHGMAAFFTSKNPAFVISNLSRDLNMAGASVAIRENKEYNAKFIKNVAKVLAPRLGQSSRWNPSKKQPTGLMPSLMRKWKNGTLDEGNETERYFKEFMEEGAETGFVNMLSIDSFKEKMEKEIRQMNGSSILGGKAKETSIGKALRLLGETFEFYNRCAEDATRFIVYMTSRQMGKTLEDSIADAKDVTLNFNRKGTGEGWTGLIQDTFIFVNPAIQALANMYGMAKNKPLRFGGVALGFVAGGVLMPVINQWLISMFGDDDDKDSYFNLPPWVRKNNLVFWIPFTHDFVTIPLAQEFRVFYGIGELIGSFIEKHPHQNGGMEVLESLADLVPINPTGNGGDLMVDFSPTAIQPLMQIAHNVDFTGKPIWKENQGNKYDPAYTKAYVSTPKLMVGLSEAINKATGGDEVSQGWLEETKAGQYVNNPAVWNHLLQGYFGGMYNTIAKAIDTSTALGKAAYDKATKGEAEMPEIHRMPVVNRFLNRPIERDDAGVLGEDYWNLVGDYDKIMHDLRGWQRRAAEGDKEADKHVNDLVNSEEYKRASVIGHYKKIIEKLRKGEKAATESADKADIKETISTLRDQMMEELSAIDGGKEPMEAAREAFGNAKTFAEKNAVRQRMERILRQGEPEKKPKKRSEEVEEALAYRENEDEESRDTDEKYLMLANSGDIEEDAKVKDLKKKVAEHVKKYGELTKEDKFEEAARYRADNQQWFTADQKIKEGEKLIKLHMKFLGKGYDANMMKLIRDRRSWIIDSTKELPDK